MCNRYGRKQSFESVVQNWFTFPEALLESLRADLGQYL
jgi:hypothetical protein